jgi:hypothetical protein
MTAELLTFFKNAKEDTIENKLNIFLSISQKIMSMLFAIESQNRRLFERIQKLENLNRASVPLTVLPPSLNPPLNPRSAPVSSTRVRNDVMSELKALFKKREGIGK